MRTGRNPVLIYLAASLDAKRNAAALKLLLEKDGHTVTSRWLTVETGYERSYKKLQEAAEMDLSDLMRADVLIHVTPEIRSSGGGADTELGYALAFGKPVIVYGDKRVNIFHYLSRVHITATYEILDALLANLDSEHGNTVSG